MAAKEDLARMQANFGALGKADPKTMRAFQGLMGAASREGELSPAMKEGIAVAIAAARGCGDCVTFHTAEAKQHGLSREAMVEILAISIEMSGGPGAVYAAKALATWDEL